MNIYDKYLEIYNILTITKKRIKFKDIVIKDIIKFSDLKIIGFEANKYLNKEIYDQCINKYKNTNFYSYKIIYNNCDINIYSSDKLTNKFILYFFIILEYLKCKESFNIYLFFLDIKKQLPSDINVPIDTINVNSGLNISNDYDLNNIIIYRKEELFKVLIHEIHHALKYYNDYKYTEAFCEAHARIYNFIFYIIKFEITNENIINAMYNRECQFNRNINYKIYIFNLDKSNNKTNVVQYYFISTYLMMNLNLLNNKFITFNINDSIEYNDIIDNYIPMTYYSLYI